MATEGPLVHDGAQSTAFANYSTSGTGLGGVGGSGQFLAMSVASPRVLSIASSSTTGPIYGVLQNTPFAGEACDIGILGLTKAVAGAAIIAGVGNSASNGELMINAAGQFIPWVIGAGNYKVGMAIESASGIGIVFLMLLYTPNVRITVGG
jgi:hypothetical protein